MKKVTIEVMERKNSPIAVVECGSPLDGARQYLKEHENVQCIRVIYYDSTYFFTRKCFNL